MSLPRIALRLVRRRVVLAAAVLGTSCVLSPLASAQAQAPPVFVRSWGGNGSGDGQLYSPLALTLDAQGNVYVCDTGNNRIQKFSSSGAFLGKWGILGEGPGQFRNATGIAVDDSNHVIVADTYNHNIQVFTTDGTFLRSFLVSSGSELLVPRRVAIGPGHTLYVTSNNDVAKITYSGDVLAKWGGLGAGPGQFYLAIGIAFDSFANLYVVDHFNARVQLFTPDGGYVASWGTFGNAAGQFNDALGIAVDPTGAIYVTDDERVQKFDASRNFIVMWGTQGPGDGQFEEAFDVAVDGQGGIYVLDDVNATVQVFHDATTPTRSTSWGRLKALFR